MNPFRYWICTLAAGMAGFQGATFAQEGSQSTSSTPSSSTPVSNPGSTLQNFGGSSNSGASSSSSAPETSSGGQQSGGTEGGSSETTSSSQKTGTETSGSGRETATEQPPSFTLPAVYGYASQVFTGGSGRLAQPRFTTRFSASQGYDDNVFQTPTKTQAQPAVNVQVLVRGSDGTLRVQTVEVVPARPAAKRISSATTMVGAGWDVMLYNRRSLFAFSLGASATYYWNRKSIQDNDYNGSLNMSYLYRFTPRLQVSAQASAAYLSQPDFSRINAPGQSGGQDYLIANTKVDLLYRWTPRITSVLSLSDNILEYQEKALSANNFNEVIVGSELRYLWSPVLTLLAEVRYGSSTYADAPNRDATSAYLLVGGELRLSARLTGSLRLGESIRRFDNSGQQASTPYMETALGYKLGPTTSLGLTARYGFEEPQFAGQERLVFRTSLSLSRAWSPRLRGDAVINYLHENSTASTGDTSSDTFDANLQMQYLFTKDFSVRASYSYTDQQSSISQASYYRNRLFLGLQYNF